MWTLMMSAIMQQHVIIIKQGYFTTETSNPIWQGDNGWSGREKISAGVHKSLTPDKIHVSTNMVFRVVGRQAESYGFDEPHLNILLLVF